MDRFINAILSTGVKVDLSRFSTTNEITFAEHVTLARRIIKEYHPQLNDMPRQFAMKSHSSGKAS